MEVSIIIPFYNSGEFINEAIQSAGKAAEGIKAEIIVVDDGSTDPLSLDRLQKIEKDGKYTLLRRSNGGPAAARNTGVKESNGEFLLFLDSDNKLRPSFIKSCLSVMRSDLKTGVVYCNAAFFGEATNRKPFRTRPFDGYELLLDNYIDVCSLVRRSTFEEVGGFDEDRKIIGYEDWDLWIRISATPWKFVYMPEILFDYRLKNNSVITVASSDENYSRVQQYVLGKHASLYHQRFSELYHETVFYKKDKQKPLRSYFKFLRDKYTPGAGRKS